MLRAILRIGVLGHWCMRRDQCQQLTLRHDLLHLIEQDLLTRAPHVGIEAKFFLFHAINARNLRAPVELIGAEFQT